MSFRLFARAPLMIDLAASAAAASAGSMRALAAQVGARSASRCRRSASARRALEDDVAAVLAGAWAEVDDVVGRADRFFVVLDDEDRVAQIAQPRRASRAARGCPAGAGRSTARRARRARRSGSTRSAWRAGCAALRRPTASRRCARASGIRRRRRRGNAGGSRISRRIRLAISASRSVSSSASKTRTASEIGRPTYSEIVRP